MIVPHSSILLAGTTYTPEMGEKSAERQRVGGWADRDQSAEDTGIQPQTVTAGRRTKGNMFEVCVHGW